MKYSTKIKETSVNAEDAINALNVLVRDLLWDYERLSTSGQKTLNKILLLLGYSDCADEFTINKKIVNDMAKKLRAIK